MIDLDRVAIVGNGYIGSSLRKKFGKNLTHPERSDTESVTLFRRYVDRHKPALVINAAGYSGSVNVDSCEEDVSKTFEENVDLVSKLCIVTANHDIPLHHISTGCVFNGNLIQESDEPNLTEGNYRHSKLEAESIVNEVGPEAKVIWRIRMPFDGRRSPRNLFTKLLKYDNLVEGENSLTSVTDLCEMLTEAVQGIPSGTYNAVNLGSYSNPEIVKLLGKTDFSVIKPDQLETVTPRSFCTLSSDKLLKLGLQLPPVHRSLSRDAAIYNYNEDYE